jgi:TIR domain-containing protein
VLFLSYASEDAARVEAFYDAFEAASLNPWMDRKDIPPGAAWEDAVFDAIARCDQFIFFLSQNSATKRGFLQREMKRAQLHWEEKLEDDLYVIPIRLDPAEMPRWLSRFQRLRVALSSGRDASASLHSHRLD